MYKIKHFMKNILIVLSLLVAMVSKAQNAGNITGVVKDKNTQELLPAASVVLQEKDTFHTMTDEDGRFDLKVGTGKYDLVVHLLSDQK